MTVPPFLPFTKRNSRWLVTAITCALTLWAVVARAQSVPPSITAHPFSLTVTQGMAASFTVTATGSEPLAYQWFHDETNLLAGATNSTLVISNVLPTNAGSYHAVVTNSFGADSSQVAILSVLGLDFGDAPDPPFPTLLAHSGACHVVIPGVHLGLGANSEPDGQPTSTASGDGAAGNGDDGVSFPGPLRIGQLASAQVVASTNGFLNAWIDFDHGSGWAGAGEQVFTNLPLVPGTNNLPFLIPSSAAAGLTFARFRFTTAPNAGFTGLAPDGEVEDYVLALEPVTADLAVATTVSAAVVAVGGGLTFSLSVTNRGPAEATNIMLVSQLSPLTQFVSASTTRGFCTNAGNTVTCLVTNLAAGAQFTAAIDTRAGPGTNVCTSTIAASQVDPIPTNNISTVAALGTRTFAPFQNPDSILLDEILGGPGSIYPSIITVSGTTTRVHKVTVTLHNVAHSFPDDLDVLLVGPGGRSVLLMSDCGLNNAISDVTLTFDDDAPGFLPDSDPRIVSGTYRPSNCFSSEDLDPPAPPRPYGNQLSVFRGLSPNGTWSLFVVDDLPEQGGFIAEGWSLDLVTSDPIADIAVTQKANVSSIPVGSNLVYTLTVTNQGPANTGVTVVDTLPPSVNFVSASASQGNCTILGNVVTCALGNLNIGGSVGITIVVVPTLGGMLTNLATVSLAGGFVDPVTSNSTTSLVTPVFPVGDVAIGSASVSGSGLVLQPLTYFIQLTNFGPNVATNFTVTNILPAGMNFVSAVPSQGGCAFAAGVVACSLGTVSPGSGATVTIVGRPGVVGANTNRIQVDASVVDFFPSNNVAEIVTGVNPVADIAVIDVPPVTNVLFGQNWSQTLLVSNFGPSTAGATLTATLAPQVQFISAIPSQGSCSNAANMVFCDLGSLAATQNVSIALITRPNALGLITNLVAVAGSVADLNSSNNTVRPRATVLSNSDLEVRSRVTPDTVWLGENVSYVLSVTNNGPSVATGVLLTNTVPATFSILFVNTSQGNCFTAGNIVNCSLGSLVAGAAVTVTISARAVSTGVVTNTARASATETDPAPANNSVLLASRIVSNSGRFTNGAAITISDLTVASPYPSTIQVSGLTATVFRVRATLTNLVHTFPDDLDVLLVGPEGQSVVLMSDAGGEVAPGSVTLTFDEDAASPVADSAVLQTGVFRPANYELTPDVWPAPAPAGPYGTNLNVFRDTNPNGLWSLYILDDDRKDSGLIANGWALTFSTLEPIADVLVAQALSANPVGVGSNLFVTCSVTNQGPAAATNLWLTNVVNPGLSIISVTPSQGTASFQNGEVTCNLGTVTNTGSAVVVIQCVPQSPMVYTNRITVGAAQRDMRPANNSSELVVEVETPPSITLHPVGLAVTNGESAVFMAAATGAEPLSLQWQRNGVNLAEATNTTLFLSNVAPSNAGRYRLRASNRVGVAFSDEAVLRVLGPPAVSDIPDQEIQEDTSTGLLSFMVEDAESPPELILLRGVSSDTNIVADSGIEFGGAGSNRTVRVTPLHDAFGLVTISVVAEDPDTSVTTQPFMLNILPVNDPPAISDVGNQTVPEDVPAVVSFIITDPETSPGKMLYRITSSNPELVPTNNVQFGIAGPATTATITPALNQAGSAVVTLHAQDEGGDVVSDSFLLTVVAVNDNPTLDMIADQNFDEDSGPHEIALTGITSGATNEFQQLIVSASSGNSAVLPAPLVNYTSPSNTARLTFLSVSNAHGTAPITVTVRDGDTTNESFSRTFTVTIAPVNDPPVLAAVPPVISPEDEPHFVAIALTDPDDDAAAINLVAHSLNQSILPDAGLAPGGSGPNRTLLLTPAPDAVGAATVQLIATDPHGAATTNTFSVTLTAVNDPPRLDAISSISIAEDAPLQSIPLTGIRPGPTNESGSVIVSAVSSNPALIPGPSVLYTNPATTGALRLGPATNATGVANITVTVADNDGLQFSRTFSVTVVPTNDPPTIATILDQATLEDTPIDLAVLVGDADTPAPLLALSAVSGNTSLVATTGIVFDGSGSNRTARITPVPNQSGNANITLFVSDGASTNSRTFQLTVVSSNDPPTLNVLTNINLQVSPGLSSFPLTGITAGPNENQALTVTVTNSNPGFFQNQPGANYNSPNTAGTLTFRVANNQTGSAIIAVTVTDNGTPPASFSRSFVLNVRSATNTLPTISIITPQTTAEDTPTAAIPFTIRDAETPAANLTLSASSSNPSLLPNANIALGNTGTNRTITLTPVADQNGDAAITLTVTDTAFGSSNMTFTLTVNPVNDAPGISSISDRSTPEEVPIEVPFTVSDVETAAGSLVVTATSSNLVLVPNSAIRVGGSGSHRALVITPAQNQTGTATINVQVRDGNATNTASFQLTVDGANDAPTLSDIGPQTTAEDSPTGPIHFVVGDVDSDLATLTLNATSSNPALVLDTNIVFGGDGSNRTVTVTPQPNASGSSVITVTVADPGGASATDSFVLTVNPVNDPPTLDPVANLLLNQNSGPHSVTLTGLNAGGGESNQTLSVSATTPDTNVVRVLGVSYGGGSTATLTLAPVQEALGAATVTVVANDGQAANNLVSRTFTVTINSAPFISYVPDQTTLERTPSGPIRLTIGDAESAADQLMVSVSSASALVPPNGVSLIGSGAQRTLFLTPAAGLSGAALISIAVSDPQGATNTSRFHLIVGPDTAPTIAPIPDQTTPEDTPISISFNITDAETPNGPFLLAAQSSSSIISPTGITFGGGGSNRVVTILGLPDRSGPTEITIQATDLSGRSSTRSFNLLISPVPDPVQILEQPHSIVVPPEGTARFEVRAEGGLTLTYQWRKDGTDIPGATNQSLIITGVQASNAGPYTVLVRNDDMASQLSNPAELSVRPLVQILSIQKAGPTATIRYATPTGATNNLEFQHPLGATNWLPVVSQVATGAVMTVVDPAATDSNRFYRIRND